MASNKRTFEGNLKSEEEGRVQIDPDAGIWVAVTIWMGVLLVHIRHFDKLSGKAKSGVSFYPNQFRGVLDLLGRGVGTHYLANIAVNITQQCSKISRTDKGTSIILRRSAVDQIREK